jgi:hypothetical protein
MTLPHNIHDNEKISIHSMIIFSKFVKHDSRNNFRGILKRSK